MRIRLSIIGNITNVTLLFIGLCGCVAKNNEESEVSKVKQSLSQENAVVTESSSSQASSTTRTTDESAARVKAAKSLDQQDSDSQKQYYKALAIAEREALKTEQGVLDALQQNLDGISSSDRSSVQQQIDALRKSMADREDRIKKSDEKSQ
jgi:hypothetical protein